MPPQFSHTTLRENVALYLRNLILGGEIPPGGKINEAEVARQLSISRGPVREALRQIEQEGFVSYTPNKGCTVKTLSPGNMAEVYLIRCTLETLAVRVFEGKLRPGTQQLMQKQCEAMRLAASQKDLPEIVAIDQEFHKTIVQEAGLPTLFKTWSNFDGGNAAIYYTMYSSDLMPHPRLAENHLIILDAFKTQDIDEINKVIEEHYMVVPKVLYQHNQQAPDGVVNLFT